MCCGRRIHPSAQASLCQLEIAGCASCPVEMPSAMMMPWEPCSVSKVPGDYAALQHIDSPCASSGHPEASRLDQSSTPPPPPPPPQSCLVTLLENRLTVCVLVQGICELCVSDHSSLLALPSAAQAGTLRVYDVLSSECSLLTEINAHKTPVVRHPPSFFS